MRRGTIVAFFLPVALAVCCASIVTTNCFAQGRVIAFPTGFNHASVTVSANPKPAALIPGALNFSSDVQERYSASGQVTVPHDALIGLEIDGTTGCEEFLARLPEDTIESLELSKAKLTNSLLKRIEKVRSLRRVLLIDCEMTDLNTTQLNGLSNLLELISIGPSSKAKHDALVTWASKSPQLQWFHDGKPLSLQDVRQFAGHQGPLFLTVSFAEDAVQLIDALAEIPHLAGLNIDVKENAPLGYYHSLAKLDHLSVINWNSGQLERDFLRNIAEIKSLRALRIQGNTQLADNFFDGLQLLKSVSQLVINASMTDRQRRVVSTSLLDMENMTHLPELFKVTRDQLARLASRSNIEALSIRGMQLPDDSELLVTAIENNPQLTYLALRDIEWNSRLAKAIAACENLNRLDLSISVPDGRLFTTPNRLQSLESLSLHVDGKAAELDSVCRLENLNSLNLSMDSNDPDQYAFIAKSKQLRRIHIADNYCDDRIVTFLKQNGEVKNFSMRQCGFLTDSGVEELSQCKQLESLAIEGFVTSKAIRTLQRLPRLQWLSVSTDLVSPSDMRELEMEFHHLKSFDIREFNPLTGKAIIGTDRIVRQVPNSGRQEHDDLEGKPLEELLGDSLSPELRQQLAGKVILVEFWGTWCGPCLNFVPELERLHEKYSRQGLVVLAIHSKLGSESADAYIEQHPKPWPNLIDKAERLQTSFKVSSFPSTFIFDTDGRLRVALPQRQALDTTLELLFNKSK